MNDADRLELPPLSATGDEPEWYDEIKGPGGYYDRSGNPISFRDWARISHWDEKNDRQYKIVKQEYVGNYWVSTVWLGLDHGFGRGAPLIFETMVFNHSPEIPEPPPFPSDRFEPDSDEWKEFFEDFPEQTQSTDVDARRYSTLEQAIEGHREMVEKVRLIVRATTKEEQNDNAS